MFVHLGRECIPIAWRCDHTVDCHDKSDENDCSSDKVEEHKSVDKNSPCSDHEFACSPHDCIPFSWVCDSSIDCKDGSDENATLCRFKIKITSMYRYFILFTLYLPISSNLFLTGYFQYPDFICKRAGWNFYFIIATVFSQCISNYLKYLAYEQTT